MEEDLIVKTLVEQDEVVEGDYDGLVFHITRFMTTHDPIERRVSLIILKDICGF